MCTSTSQRPGATLLATMLRPSTSGSGEHPLLVRVSVKPLRFRPAVMSCLVPARARRHAVLLLGSTSCNNNPQSLNRTVLS